MVQTRTSDIRRGVDVPLLHGISREECRRLLDGEHAEPHRILGAHPARMEHATGVVIRALHPEAAWVECVLPDQSPLPMQPVADGGLFAVFLPHAEFPVRYRLRFHLDGGATYEHDDPYRFLPTLGDLDLHLFNEGNHRRLWQHLGAHVRTIDGVTGVSFSVWAPNAVRVSVVGDFCRWDGRVYPMRQMGSSGVFEIFLPELQPGTLYKYEIKTRDGHIRLKTDPYAAAMEVPPGTASRVYASSYEWGDGEWMSRRASLDVTREALTIYEVHLGSWARIVEEGNRPLTYRELAGRLVEHVKRFGFTHIELLPIAEHPFSGSWGYQVSGYYAPTSRYGSPDDFRLLVDTCHRNGIGVILDWVPAHFPRDDFALRWFDGTALYEHADPRLGEHPDWGTLVFNYGRNEVRNFLVANALYWLEEFHVDGLRVDAVASMLYLDYSRKEGEWVPNRFGGRENLEAIDFIRQLNEAVRNEHPGVMMIAEESTAWGGVTRPVADGGLGFTFKWNMGWMHDTLVYFSKDPIHRSFHQHDLTFAMLYEYTERFIMPLSHDEVVHGKRSLLEKMPGDLWQRFANLRLLLTYHFTRPGKKLLFMGTELAPYNEWNHDTSLDWHLANEPPRVSFAEFLAALGRLYREHPCLWRNDHQPGGFYWVDCDDVASSVLSFVRQDDGGFLLIVLNMTPVPREGYRIGVPLPGRYVERFSSDDPRFGGSEFVTLQEVHAEPTPWNRQPHSVVLNLPPLGAIVLARG